MNSTIKSYIAVIALDAVVLGFTAWLVAASLMAVGVGVFTACFVGACFALTSANSLIGWATGALLWLKSFLVKG